MAKLRTMGVKSTMLIHFAAQLSPITCQQGKINYGAMTLDEL